MLSSEYMLAKGLMVVNVHDCCVLGRDAVLAGVWLPVFQNDILQIPLESR
jgi:hypothetical protein